MFVHFWCRVNGFTWRRSYRVPPTSIPHTGGTEANREFHAYLPKWSCFDRWRPSPAGKHCHFQWLLHRSDPTALALLADTVVRARLLNERARAFMRPATASPSGWYGEAALPFIHLFFSLFLTPLDPFYPTKTQLHRTRGGAKSRGDTDSHGSNVSLCTHPLSILFDFTRLHIVNPLLPAFVSPLSLSLPFLFLSFDWST